MTMTPNKQDKQSPWWKWIFIALGLLVVIVGVPIGINECYKANTGYITVWNGADVLSYYGTIISTIIAATIAILTMVATILFTRKQIQRDTYLKNEREKWMKIEGVFTAAIESMNPLYPMTEVIDLGFSKAQEAMTIYQKYQISCHISTNQIKAAINSADYAKVEPLADTITQKFAIINKVIAKAIKEYEVLHKFSCRATAQQVLDTECKNRGTFSPDMVSFYGDIIDSTNGLQLDSIKNKISKVNEEIIQIYNQEYLPLIQKRNIAFEAIYAEVDHNAEKILYF